MRCFGIQPSASRNLSNIDRSTTAKDVQSPASFSARKNPQRIPANTPPVFPSLAPLIWPHLICLVTKAMSDRLLAHSTRDMLDWIHTFLPIRSKRVWAHTLFDLLDGPCRHRLTGPACAASKETCCYALGFAWRVICCRPLSPHPCRGPWAA